MSRLWWTPFFDGDDGLVLLILARLVQVLLCQNLRLTAREKHLDSFGQIFDHWESVCALDGLGSTFTRSGGILPTPPITTHHRQIRLLVHPPCVLRFLPGGRARDPPRG